MSSLTYRIFEGNAPDPRQNVYDVYYAICQALRNLPKTKEVEDLYRKENAERASDYQYRNGNASRFDFDDITDITARNGTITIELGYSKPCGRGCCSDYVTDSMEIPDALIAAYDEVQRHSFSDDYSESDVQDAQTVFHDAVNAHAGEILAALDTRIAVEKLEAERKKEAARVAAETRAARKAEEAEQRDREEFERLKAKYQETTNER